MKNVGKITLFMAIALALIGMGSQCFAGGGIVSGTIQYYRLHNATTVPGWTPPKFWFTLNGVNSAGACPTWGGNVLFVAESKEELALIMSAYATGSAVAVAVDDANKDSSGYCKAEYMTAGNPPPLM